MILGTAAIGALGVFSMHVLLPALPAIRDALGSDDATVQLLISLGMLAIAFGNLVVGPLSDRFGRKPVTYAGLGLFVGGSALAAAAPGVEVLIFARIVQAFGGGAAMSVARAMVTDFFGAGGAAASAMAYSAMTVLVVPMVAPTIGGFTIEWANWRTTFALTLVVGVTVTALTMRRLGETQVAASAGHPRPGLVRSYRQLLGTPEYLGRALCCTALMCTVYTFIAGAPYVGIHVMGLRPSTYGLLFVLPAIASFCGFLVAGRVSRRAGPDRMIRYGVIGSFTAVASFAILMAAGLWHPLALFVPGMVLTFSNAIAVPSAMSSAIAVRPDIAGAASGLTGFMQLAVSAAATQAVAALADGTPAPLAGTMAVANGCAIVAFLVMIRLRARAPTGPLQAPANVAEGARRDVDRADA
ncbi:MAG TPA: multidrug effflux MFS transporter [Steroidobacteraceae bacterium]|nr:multidrug effflux MFS transporter [Steroidobacteraceae bacterium]